MSAEKPTKSNPSALSAKVDKKRKRQAEEPSKPAETSSGNAAEPTTKKAKNGKGKNKKDKKKTDGDKTEKKDEQPKDTKQTETKGGIDEAIGKMDGRLLADHFVQRAKRHNKELTAVELSDMSVPGKMFFSFSLLPGVQVETMLRLILISRIQTPHSWIPRLSTNRDSWRSSPHF